MVGKITERGALRSQLAEANTAASQLELAKQSLTVARQRGRDEHTAVGRLQEEKVSCVVYAPINS